MKLTQVIIGIVVINTIVSSNIETVLAEKNKDYPRFVQSQPYVENGIFADIVTDQSGAEWIIERSALDGGTSAGFMEEVIDHNGKVWEIVKSAVNGTNSVKDLEDKNQFSVINKINTYRIKNPYDGSISSFDVNLQFSAGSAWYNIICNEISVKNNSPKPSNVYVKNIRKDQSFGFIEFWSSDLKTEFKIVAFGYMFNGNNIVETRAE